MPRTDGHVAHQVEVVEVPAQGAFFPLSRGVDPRSRLNLTFSQGHAAIGDAVIVVGVFCFASQVDGGTLGLAFVEPAVA